MCCPISLLPDIITSVGLSGDIWAWSCQAGVRIVACGAFGLVERWSPPGSETALLLVGGKGVLHSSEASETPGFTGARSGSNIPLKSDTSQGTSGCCLLFETCCFGIPLIFAFLANVETPFHFPLGKIQIRPEEGCCLVKFRGGLPRSVVRSHYIALITRKNHLQL